MDTLIKYENLVPREGYVTLSICVLTFPYQQRKFN